MGTAIAIAKVHARMYNIIHACMYMYTHGYIICEGTPTQKLIFSYGVKYM